MFVIKVWCLPKMEQDRLEELFKKIVAVVTNIEALAACGYKDEKSMLVLFPLDVMTYGLGSEILIEVEGLPNVPSINTDVRVWLCSNLGILFKDEFPGAHIVCKISPIFKDETTWFSDVGFVCIPKS